MRKKAREVCFKTIYKNLFLQNDYSFEEIASEENLTEEDLKFVETIVSLFQANKDEINKKIDSCLIAYTPDRVYSIDRAILDVAVTEIVYFKETPIPVVINEAVELAKTYSTEKSYSFVNGVLKKIVQV